jgi:hypothetical protein
MLFKTAYTAQMLGYHHNWRCVVGVLYGVTGGRVCGYAVCSPCSFKFGNEGVIRCHFHSSVILDKEDIDDKDCSITSESGSEKENIPPLPPSPTRKKSCAKGKATMDLVSQVKLTNKVSAREQEQPSTM